MADTDRGVPLRTRLTSKQVRFMNAYDTCCLATVESGGSPHCVPVSYVYLKGHVYIVTYSGTRKVKNIVQDPRCCLLVETGRKGRGRGLMLQGRASLVGRASYESLRRSVESTTGWHLNEWDIAGHKPDLFLKFTPTKAVEIGEL